MKKIFTCLFVLQFLMSSCLFATIENSIIPQVERIENIQNLPREKLSRLQYAEIKHALTRIDQKIRVLSYNVLFNLYDHNLDNHYQWPQRLPRIIEVIEEMQPDIIGVQELYTDQYKDLMPYLEKTYGFYSKTCENGELNGIFFRLSRFDVLNKKVWAMTTPQNAPNSDTLTMLKLKDKITGKCIAVFNTHLAFSKINKRDIQARYIAEHIKSYAGNMPTLLMGDLNTFPTRLDLEKLPFYDGDYIHRILTKDHLYDAKEQSLLGHLGTISTFSNAPESGDPFKGLGTPGVFLDHIYVSKGIKVLIHAVQSCTVNGYYPSDHFPLFIDLLLN